MLIASPQMVDPHFARAVVLLWQHNDDGAQGVIVNRLVEHDITEVLETAKQSAVAPHEDSRVVFGGPVDPTTGTVVTTGQVHAHEGHTMACGLGVTHSEEALFRLLNEGEPIVLCLGYAGWGPGQLDSEIERGGWLYIDAKPELVFGSDPEDLYERALATLGLKEHQVWMHPIHE